MSLINKMLQELDRRHATQAPQPLPEAGSLDRGLLAVKAKHARIGSELFWWVLAAAMAMVIAWVAWVMWQITPRSVVTDLALQSAQKARAAKAEPAQAPAAASTDSTAAPATTAGAPAGEAEKVDLLRLATEMAAPSAAPRAKPAQEAAAAKAEPKAARQQAVRAADEPKPVAKSAGVESKAAPAKAEAAPAKSAARPDASKSPTAAAQVSRPEVQPRPAVAASDAGKIDKRLSASSRERADGEFRRASALVNQGRVSEGMEGLRGALAHDSAHDAARHTLVSLLLEARRIDEAALMLQEGLAVSPSNTAFAMMLARIMVDRKDIAGALTLLQRHAGAAESNAEYRAFTAALFQRLGRHKDAIDEYHAALRISPSAGVWWVGLAISHEASDRPKEAWDAFRRAKATGNLTPDLVAFVDQRLKQQH